MDYQALPPVDLQIMADTDPTVAAILDAATKAGGRKKATWPDRKPFTATSIKMGDAAGPIAVPMMAAAMQKAVEGKTISLIRHPLSWAGHLWPMKHPLDHLGSDGGGGVGSGPGTTVGAALALRGTGRLPVAILGDGDFLMGNNAIWTAVHYRIPLLVVIANNRSFYNDELHQERMARERGRPVENKWIGQQMKGPEIDLAMIARAQGAVWLRAGHAPRRARRHARQGGEGSQRGQCRGRRRPGRARLRPGLLGGDHARARLSRGP